MKRKWIVAAALTVAATVLAASATKYVKRPANLRAEPKTSADEVGKLATGVEATVLEKKGLWYKIQAGGKEGWVHRSRLTRKKPSKGAIAEGKTLAAGDIQATRVKTSASVRGLAPKAASYAKSKGISARAIADTDRITEYKIASADLEQFMKQGRLGEYSEGGG